MGLGPSIISTAVLSERRTAGFPLQNKPLLCQGFLFMGLGPSIISTAVLSECRTTGFPLQTQKAPALSGFFVYGTWS